MLDAVFPVATIELVSDWTVPFAIQVDVGVEQIELHTTNIHTPDVSENGAARVRHFKNHLLASFIKNRLDWKLVEVLCLVVSDLLTIERK